jgi:AraC family transcriptional regulator
MMERPTRHTTAAFVDSAAATTLFRGWPSPPERPAPAAVPRNQSAAGQSEAGVRPPEFLPTRCVQPLQKWRLLRVVDFVEANLAERITLARMAAAAGLTAMHFAAQFRVAAGVRPHEYVLRRRVDKACKLLRDTTLPIVEVALAVGFQSQAHFTTVFKRFAGEPPYRWRRRAATSRVVAAAGVDDRPSV